MGESKKRKMDYYEEEDEDEEEKIERFFALIKSTRLVCEKLKGSSNWPPLEKKAADHQDKSAAAAAAAWNPAFQPEDFLDHQDDKAISAGHEAGPSKIQEEEKKGEKVGDGLDLKLSL